MGIERFFIQDVTIRRAPLAESRYHDQLPDWTNATETDTKGWLGRTSAQEVVDNRDAVVTGSILYLAADEDIVAKDRVVVGGVTYEVDGPPHLAHTPRGAHHWEAALRAVEG